MPFLTEKLNLDQSATVRVGRGSTKSVLEEALESVLFGIGPREVHELFTHGRRPQWRWFVFVQGYDMTERQLLEDDGQTVASLAGPNGKTAVSVVGRIDYDPDYEHFRSST